MTEYQWNTQQSRALEEVGAWLKDSHAPQVRRLFGYAGTGKTTLARYLAMHVRAPLFAAFTGKAASVLREAGCPGATTLHSLLYNVRDRDRSKLDALRATLDEMLESHPDYPETMAEYRIEQDKVKRPWFYVNENSPLKTADLLVCDEVSMVDARIGKDMESFGKKILVLGDPAQLPPIGGGGYFTSARPDNMLTEVHRQAADNPVLRWATMARRGEVIPFGDEGAAKKFRRARISMGWLAKEAGQVLVGKNETRHLLNKGIRAELGRTSPFPQDKDTMVMLMNDHRLGVLNGTICWAWGAALTEDDTVYMSLKYPEEGTKHCKLLRDLCVDPGPFLGRPCADDRKKLQLDFGYALTVHKAQGSQWETVTLYDDGFAKREAETRRRWLYTAITRAQKTLNIVTSA